MSPLTNTESYTLTKQRIKCNYTFPYISDIRNTSSVDEVRTYEVAWLLSFPNSGTTYTNHLIQEYTNTTTATNYGQEQSTKERSIPIFPNYINGPFFRYPTWNIPSSFILTKTHCGGDCDSCQTPGNIDYDESLEAFELLCRSGKRIISTNGTKVKSVYSSDIPKKAVHLIRDPFDNVVARLHLKERRWARFEGKKEKFEERLNLYNSSRDGFRAYCKFRDHQSIKQDIRIHSLNNTVLQYIKDVPCYAEFVRYTKWHNKALEIIQAKGLPIMTLFYENYASNWNTTVHQLLNFLDLYPSTKGNPPAFVAGKEYKEFYNEIEIYSAIKLIESLASSQLLKFLNR